MNIKDYGKVFVIAEAGVNHNGDVNLAKKLIEAASDAGADAIKFQTFLPGECTGKFAFKVSYQEANSSEDESRFEESSKLALPFEDFVELKKHAQKKGILFLSTPDGQVSLDFLVDTLDVPLIKISSTEVTHLDFLEKVAAKQRPIILSTGMSNLDEVEAAVTVIRKVNDKELILLHCTTEYPAPFDEINIKAMVTLKNTFNLTVGYSDHSIGKEAAIAAVALGAQVIEKHLTLDRTLPGPDHKASMDPDGFEDLVNSIRLTERLMGDGIKKPTSSELKNIAGVRRGIVAMHGLKKGATLTKEDLTFKRPNTGITPDRINEVIGKKLIKDLESDEVVQWEHLSE